MDKYGYRTQLYLNEEHYRFLKEQSERYKISKAEVIRQLIEKEMGKQDKELEDDPIFRLAEKGFDMGRGNGSYNHDQYIYGNAVGETDEK